MSDLPSVTGEQAKSAFSRFGFRVARIKGAHHIMKKPGHRYSLSVPVHKGDILKKGTLRTLIDIAGITVDEFVAALD
jgi:predicted RNA binding protein YcfA (HicA-like mRNA interferase family)